MAGKHVPRLHCAQEIIADSALSLGPDAARHLGSVMRLGSGDEVILFDTITGEWRAVIEAVSKRDVVVRPAEYLRPRETVPDIWLLAAPIKRTRFEWTAEKACELGAARFQPVITERTGGVEAQQAKPERLRAHMIEAAEQCGRTALPELADAAALSDVLADWPENRALIFCDEEGGEPALDVMRTTPAPAAILIGPEGGFSDAERDIILSQANSRRLSMGTRILRADTAAAAALAIWQAYHGG
ncbi:MAG: 16S rRNA (uracil(1498)-N(3))-methyltransferase [Pacificimonas sp.]